MGKSVIATFRTTKEHKDRIDNLAKATKRSSAFFYNYLLDEYLDELEDIFVSEQRMEDVRAGKSTLISLDEIEEKYGL
ncbi:MAG: CopG family transcriptional regulator [Treponema sp.]|nr:CopG family transcriptional regulator [Treponema sp.]